MHPYIKPERVVCELQTPHACGHCLWRVLSCEALPAAGEPVRDERGAPRVEQAGGCGGFGKGNFSELFKSIEDFERTLEV